MKRSEINQIMREAKEFIRQRGFYLPPFAYWTMEDWKEKGNAAKDIVDCQMGWDITDFGSGDFSKTGLFLFTIRNGKQENLRIGTGKVYAEKLMIVNENQATPLHFHWNKMEDIINRGGGRLAIELYNSLSDEELDQSGEVKVSVDGMVRVVPAGGMVELEPGESITLTPGCYHTFWAVGGKTLVGEVSLVNDDEKDNHFYKAPGRFPAIDEDETPLHLLTMDYHHFLQDNC